MWEIVDFGKAFQTDNILLKQYQIKNLTYLVLADNFTKPFVANFPHFWEFNPLIPKLRRFAKMKFKIWEISIYLLWTFDFILTTKKLRL